MSPPEVILSALESLASNKLRSLLTALGVIIGVAAVIAMMALGEGAQRSVAERFKALGTSLLTVRPGQAFSFGVSQGQARLTLEDAEALIREPRAIVAVAPEMESRVQVEHGTNNANLSVVGTWPSYFQINNFSIAEGRFFTEAEERGRRRVVVIGALVGDQLSQSSRAMLGQSVNIKGVAFEVIGVLAEKGAQGFSNPDEGLYVPLSTARLRLTGGDRVRSIGVQANSDLDLGEAMIEVDQVLRREHRLRPGEEADFNIRNQAMLLNTFQETARTLSLLLAGIATISLLVGGIGIMNIMLVSVTERTREIGLRKAVGARPRDILAQFLVEALVLCAAGGLLGILVGVGGSLALRNFAGWSVAIAPTSVVLAFVFAAGVGIFFGLWPARRAAALSPIEALRYE